MEEKSSYRLKGWERRRFRENEMAEHGFDWPEYLIWKAHRFVEQYGALTSIDWNPAMIRSGHAKLHPDTAQRILGAEKTEIWPAVSTVQKHFGSWRNFMEKAGLPCMDMGQRHPDRVDAWREHMVGRQD